MQTLPTLKSTQSAANSFEALNQMFLHLWAHILNLGSRRFPKLSRSTADGFKFVSIKMSQKKYLTLKLMVYEIFQSKQRHTDYNTRGKVRGTVTN